MNLSKDCIPQSSDCIIWQGPDIECLDLCYGDNITTVLYKLALLVCDILTRAENGELCDCEGNSTGRIYTCTLESGEQFTATSDQIIEHIFTEFICKGQVGVTQEGQSTLEILREKIALPQQLQYTDPLTNKIVTELFVTDYIEYLATKMCEVMQKNEQQDGQIGQLFNAINGINNALNNIVIPEPVKVKTDCTYSGGPGLEVLIEEAYEDFEENYCNYKNALLGNVNDWESNFYCEQQGNVAQLNNPESNLNDLPNWKTDLTLVANQYNNLNLIVDDMRTALKNLLQSQAVLPCILVPAKTIEIADVGTLGCNINWEEHVLDNIQSPIQAEVKVYDTNNDLIHSDIIVSENYTYYLINASIVPDTTYTVKIFLHYNCGISEGLTVTGVLKNSIE